MCGQILIDQLDNDICIEPEERQNIDELYVLEKNSWKIE